MSRKSVRFPDDMDSSSTTSSSSSSIISRHRLGAHYNLTGLNLPLTPPLTPPTQKRPPSDGHIFNPSNMAFMSAVGAAAGASSRGPVQTLWNTILYTCFTPTEYIIAFKELPLSNVSVLELRLILAPPSPGGGGGGPSPFGGDPALDPYMDNAEEPRLFMIEYWASTADTPGGWDAAREQFARYMEAKVAPGRRMLCAVGIGARCEVYGWDGVILEHRHDGVLDLRGREGRRELERQLRFVERSGLDFAQPVRPWSRRTGI